MPLPSDHNLLRWQYSLVKEELFDDGRNPRAVTLAGEHWSIPQLTWAEPPSQDVGGLGCWWYPQDLAAAPVPNAVAVLSVAARCGAIPVLGRHVIAEASEVHLLREVDISVPLEAGVLSPAQASAVKRALTGLIRADGASIENALMACKEVVDGEINEVGGASLLPLSLGVTEFPYIGGPGARSQPRTHPAVIFHRPVASAGARLHPDGR
jgi:hypothetical protein